MVSEPRDILFQHLVRDVAESYSVAFDHDSPPPDAFIKMEINEEGDFWLSANSQGYLHLARCFAELGLRQLENGYHYHRNARWSWSDCRPEFSFEVDNTCGRGPE